MALKSRGRLRSAEIDRFLYIFIMITLPILLLYSSWQFSLALNTLSEKNALKPQLGDSIPDFGSDGLKDLTDEQKAKLFSGEVVMISSPDTAPDGKTMISAAMLFEVPIGLVWRILSATEKQIEYLEEIENLKVLELGADFNRIEFVVKVMGKKVRYTVIHHFVPEKYYFYWTLDPEAHNDLKEFFGFWRFYSIGENRTVGRYASYLLPDFPVPEFIRNWLYKNSVRSSLQKVKKYVEGRPGTESLVSP